MLSTLCSVIKSYVSLTANLVAGVHVSASMLLHLASKRLLKHLRWRSGAAPAVALYLLLHRCRAALALDLKCCSTQRQQLLYCCCKRRIALEISRQACTVVDASKLFVHIWGANLFSHPLGTCRCQRLEHFVERTGLQVQVSTQRCCLFGAQQLFLAS